MHHICCWGKSIAECTSKESQITPAVLWMNIHKNPGISQSLFVIPSLIRQSFHVHPKFSPAFWRASKLITITPIVPLYESSEIPVTPVPVIRDPSYSEGLAEYPPRVSYSTEIDASKFTLHILSDTPGVFQRLKYIVLMVLECNSRCAWKLPSSGPRDTLECRDWASLEMHLEPVIELRCRYTWRLWSSEIAGSNRANLEAITDRVWMST